MCYLFFIFLLCASLVADNTVVTEGEPSSLVEGIVSVITGDAYLSEEDIVIEGAEPLRLRRSYIGKGWGGHAFFSHLYARIHPTPHIVIAEPNGSVLYFFPSQEEEAKKHNKKISKKSHQDESFYLIYDSIDFTRAQGVSNTARGKISATTNIKNIRIHQDYKHFTVFCADGTERRYRLVRHQKKHRKLRGLGFETKELNSLFYYLQYEELPTGNKIVYDWNKDNKLISIRTTNPSGNKTYAKATFEYLHKKESSPPDFNVSTSDGRLLEYRHKHFKVKKEDHFILENIYSPEYPNERLDYVEKNGIPHLSLVSLNHGRDILFQRDDQGRVKEIKAYAGKDNALVTTQAFAYFPNKRYTEVTDSTGALTKYSWSTEMRLTCIERYTQDKALYNTERFGWGANGTPHAGNLLYRTLYDADNIPLFSRSYSYDGRGNIEEESFWGNLTGSGFLEVSTDGSPTKGEVYRKRYTYNDRNAVLREEEDNGKVSTYAYLPGTVLCTAHFTHDAMQIKSRRFMTYNSDKIAMREVEDDGSSTDPEDLSGVTTRKIKEITLMTEGPYLNMPRSIEEKYWDGTSERPLKRTCFTYTTGGNVAAQEVFDAANNHAYTLTTKYDSKGRPLEESNALGQIAFSSYDPVGNKIFFQDFSGSTQTTMYYDWCNRLAAIEEKSQETTRYTTYAYDTKHQKIAGTDFRGNTTHYAYDAFNHLLRTEFPPLLDQNGSEKTFSLQKNFDSAGREILSSDALGNTTQKCYNAYGKPLKILYSDGTAEHFLYNLDGTLNTHTDQQSTQTRYAYDYLGRETTKSLFSNDQLLSYETYTYSAFHLLSSTDAEGNTTTYSYDGAGRKIAEELDKERLDYNYDSLGRIHTIGQDALLTVKEYDLLNRLLLETRQDLKGNILFQEERLYDSAGNQTSHITYPLNRKAEEHYIYDPFHRLIEKRDPLGYVTHITYDDHHQNALGQNVLQKSAVDPLGNSIVETFDAKGRLIQIEKRNKEQKLLSEENTFYDGNDNLCCQESAVLSDQVPMRAVTTLWYYDSQNRLITLTEAARTPEEKTTHYTYTPTGLLLQKTKPDGTVIHHTYDPLGRCIDTETSDGSIHYTFTYNRIGQLLTSHDAIAHTTTQKTWNAHGQLLQETLANSLTLTNSYDIQGRRTKLQLPDNTYITYTYDPLYLRTVSRYTTKATPFYSHDFTQYDLAGNLLKEKHPFCGSSTHQIDPLHRTYSIDSPYYSQQILVFDPAGNILSMRFPEETVTYTYDDLYQLTQETGLFAHTYSYDSHFNRLSKDQEFFTPNALNQISSFVYDPNGNPLFDGKRSYTYDALDRLIAIEEGSLRLHYTYDADHRRISKQLFESNQEKKNIFYLYDGQNEIGSVDSSGAWQDLRILGRTESAEIGSAIAIELQGEIHIPLHDLQGNICRLISPYGHIVEKYRYSAFGEEKNTQSTSPWRFSSKRIDEETGLVYYGRRYYSPEYGRWLTPDPQGLTAGINLYAFVSNDPLIKVDLYGLIEEALWYKDVKRESFQQVLNASKNLGFGIAHGAKDMGVNAALGTSYIGYALSMPFRAPLWTMNRGSFSGDWQSFKASNEAFRNTADRWMQRALPADRNNSYYQASRSFTRDTLELTSMFMGTAGMAKGGVYLAEKGTSLLRRLNSSTNSRDWLKFYSQDTKRIGKASFDAKFQNEAISGDWAYLNGMLKQASKQKGNFGMGSATFKQANAMGEAWVGPNYKISNAGKVWISQDGMRQYRQPMFKRQLGKTQANFQSKFEGQESKEWQNNGHLDVLDMLEKK